MTNNKDEKLTLVIRRASPRLKIALCVLILIGIGALAALRYVDDQLQAQTEALTQEAAAQEAQQQELEQRLEDVDSVDNLKQIAREELGLVDPNTVLIHPHQSGSLPETTEQTSSETLP